MIEYGAVFMGGVLGSAHCLGMCGGFAAALGAADIPFWPVFARQLIYSLGRICTYSFLGAVSGAAGLYLSQFRTPLVQVQQVFSFLAGAFMIVIALSVFGVLPRRYGTSGGLLAPVFAQFLNARTWLGFFLAGLANGFLPCGLVYSFLALSVATADVTRGMLTMAMFGLGTAPAMVAIGCGSRLLPGGARLRVLRGAAVLVLVMGGVTIYRALPASAGSCCHDDAAPAANALESPPRRRDDARHEAISDRQPQRRDHRPG